MNINQPIICVSCGGSGTSGWWRCGVCRGMAIGLLVRHVWLYWNFPLTRYNVTLTRLRRLVGMMRLSVVIFLAASAWGGSLLLWYRSGVIASILARPDTFFVKIFSAPPAERFLFWLGVLLLTYAWYLRQSGLNAGKSVERHNYNDQTEAEPTVATASSFAEVFKIPKNQRFNIAATFTPEAIGVVAGGYASADKNNSPAYTSAHLFSALLANNRVANIFIRLGISAASIQKQLAPMLANAKKYSSRGLAPATNLDLYALLFAAYERAFALHQDYVSVTELLEAVVMNSEPLLEILLALDIDQQKLINVVAWARIRENLFRRYVKFHHSARHRSTKGMDRAMTALATPYLNQFSEDITLAAQFGRVESCVAREPEIEEIFRVVESGGANVLLSGETGVGKRTIVEGLAERMVVGDVPKRLYDKRLVRLSTSALLAGVSPAGAVERVRFIMAEIARARNIILFINNIHELSGVSAGGGGAESLDVAGALSEFLNGGRWLTIATTTNEAFSHSIARSPLGNTFAKIEVREMDINQAIQVLESKAGYIEYKHKVFFAYSAVESAVQLARRYLHDTPLPGSAQEILSEAAAWARARKGDNSLVTNEAVAAVVAAKTKIPVAAITQNETEKLLHLEAALHRRIIGQNEAVTLVANALRRSRADLRASNRPIANFLFLGPTGVGKTELAKTIAAVYFGGETRMTRLDMSEYQDKASVYRLIGTPNEKGSGVLTEKIRREPFTLLLLDEIEKADPDILNLFLQVMDDGRLSDSTGRLVDFTNVILIATSNAGTQYVQDQLRLGIATEIIKNKLLHGELKDYFRPEFLNRFDGIVLFKALDRADIKQVAGLMLERVVEDLSAKGITLQIEPAALDWLADVGYDPDFGARPLRRALEERVENKLAELLLSGQLKRRDTVVLGAEGEMRVKKS